MIPRDDVPTALFGLLELLPGRWGGARSWTGEDREQFLQAFTAVLDITVPIVDEPETNPDGVPCACKEVRLRRGGSVTLKGFTHRTDAPCHTAGTDPEEEGRVA